MLVDAPCSSLGVLRRHPSLRWDLSPDHVERFPALQLAILHNASLLVRPGGRLVYATCSLDISENTAVALEFERLHSEFERWDFEESFPGVRDWPGAAEARVTGAADGSEMLPHRTPDCASRRDHTWGDRWQEGRDNVVAGDEGWGVGGQTNTRWLLPHLHGTDGFYIARWRRRR